ncbi:hypothetical protein HK104_004223 [Borealophlyctis nickersoniae]|nr:hypothetical protein HK104_004223 [Borealophlyctis nickersoniae]
MNDILLLTTSRYLTLTGASRLRCTSNLFASTITDAALLKILQKHPSEKWYLGYSYDHSVSHYYVYILDYFLPESKNTSRSDPVTINTFTRLTRLVLETDLKPLISNEAPLIINEALKRATNAGWVDAVCLLADLQITKIFTRLAHLVYETRLPPPLIIEALTRATDAGSVDAACLLADHSNVDRLPSEERWIWFRQDNDRKVSCAVRKGFADVVGALLDRGLPAGDAVEVCIDAPRDKVEEVAWVLVGKGVSILNGEGKCEVMRRAISAKREDLVRVWLKCGADPCEEDNLPLSMAVYKGSTVIVDILLAAGADIESRSGGAIRTAVKNRDKPMLQHLMAKGANVRVGNDIARRIAILNCDIDCAEILTQAGCAVHSDDDACLISMVEKSNPTMTRFLLDYGANVHANNDLALKTAVVNRRTEMITLLSTYGATVDTVPDAILISAVQTRDLTKTREAIHRGADVSTMNSYPLKIAVMGQHPEMVRLLLEHGAKVASLEGTTAAQKWQPKSCLYTVEIARIVLEYCERD